MREQQVVLHGLGECTVTLCGTAADSIQCWAILPVYALALHGQKTLTSAPCKLGAG